jgi:hypothetical protein
MVFECPFFMFGIFSSRQFFCIIWTFRLWLCFMLIWLRKVLLIFVCAFSIANGMLLYLIDFLELASDLCSCLKNFMFDLYCLVLSFWDPLFVSFFYVYCLCKCFGIGFLNYHYPFRQIYFLKNGIAAKLGRDKLPEPWVEINKIDYFLKFPLFGVLRGGVGRRCRLWWRFFRLYCRPKNTKKPIFSINFMFSPEGGVPPKHSAFCGGCFSINPYKSVFGTFLQNRGRKITNRRLFPSVPKCQF